MTEVLQVQSSFSTGRACKLRCGVAIVGTLSRKQAGQWHECSRGDDLGRDRPTTEVMSKEPRAEAEHALDPLEEDGLPAVPRAIHVRRRDALLEQREFRAVWLLVEL